MGIFDFLKGKKKVERQPLGPAKAASGKEPSIALNVAGFDKEWVLERNGERTVIIQGLLSSLLLVGSQSGWTCSGLFDQQGGMTSLKLKACDLSDSEAKALGATLSGTMRDVPDDPDGMIQQIRRFVAFVHSGAFKLYPK